MAIAINNSTATSNTTSSTSTTAGKNTLTANDFMNLMVKQLQNQDPLNPTSNSELLGQESQIAQLQSSTSLQTTLQTFIAQSSLTSASAMIGKQVTGTDSNSKPLSGVVTSVQVAGGNVSLELDNGNTMALGNVTSVAPVTPGATTPVK